MLSWQQIILYITTVGMEGGWAYTFLALLNEKVAGGRLAIPGLLLIYPIAFGFNLMLRRLKWPRAALTGINWLIWVAVIMLTVKFQLYGETAWSDATWRMAIPHALGQILFAFRPELIILIGSAVLWWFGSRLAHLRMNFATLVNEFQFGLPVLVILFFFIYEYALDINLIAIALLFFGFALLGMSIAHAQESTSWLSGLYRGHWLGLLLISIGVVLSLGLLIGLLINPDFIQLILWGIKWLWGLFMKVMDWIASLIPPPSPGEPLPPGAGMPDMGTEPKLELFTMSEALRNALRIAWSILVIGLVLVALWRISAQIFDWLRHKMSGDAGVEMEPVRGAFKADLLNFLRWFLSLFRIKFHPKPKPARPEITSVRQLYRRLLRWAAAGGLPRHLAQTPDEYRQVLVGWLPEVQEELNYITRWYSGVRYGQLIPAENELQELKQSWSRIKQSHPKKIAPDINL